MADVAMPRLSDSMEEGTILKWLKSEGDSVAKGEELVEIETDKANMTYEADEEGTLAIVAQEGDTLAVGETICTIGEAAGDAGDSGGSDDAQESGADADAPAEEESGEADDADEAEDSGEDESASDEADDDEDSGEDAADAGDESAEDEPAEDADSGDDQDAEDAEDSGDDDAPEDEAEDDADDDAESGDEPAADDAEDEQPAGEESDDQGAEETEPESPETHDAGGRVKASPIAKRMARELGIDLAQVHGTGPGGRIVKADVEAFGDEPGAPAAEEEPEAQEQAGADADAGAAEEPEPESAEPESEPESAEPEPESEAQEPEEAPAPVATPEDKKSGRGEVTKQELTRIQQTVARRMAESKATAPEFVITAEIDMTAAIALREQFKTAVDGPPPSLNDLVIKASALALRDFPRANGAYRDGAFELYGRVNVGMAVAGQDALIVPTIFDADEKTLGAIATESRALAERVRAGEITPPELSSGTFTVSNLGMFGIRNMVAVINPPQAGILGVGEVVRRPVFDDAGQVVARSLMELTLTCDHRILYGADAATFLGKIKEYLQTPLRLAL